MFLSIVFYAAYCYPGSWLLTSDSWHSSVRYDRVLAAKNDISKP